METRYINQTQQILESAANSLRSVETWSPSQEGLAPIRRVDAFEVLTDMFGGYKLEKDDTSPVEDPTWSAICDENRCIVDRLEACDIPCEIVEFDDEQNDPFDIVVVKESDLLLPFEKVVPSNQEVRE